MSCQLCQLVALRTPAIARSLAYAIVIIIIIIALIHTSKLLRNTVTSCQVNLVKYVLRSYTVVGLLCSYN